MNNHNPDKDDVLGRVGVSQRLILSSIQSTGWCSSSRTAFCLAQSRKFQLPAEQLCSYTAKGTRSLFYKNRSIRTDIKIPQKFKNHLISSCKGLRTSTYIPWYIVHIEMSATAIEEYVENYYGNLNKVIWNEVLRVGN